MANISKKEKAEFNKIISPLKKQFGDSLHEAYKIINGERRDQYGDVEDSFELIADYWSTYLEAKIEPKDVAMMMVLLKIAREKNQHKHDNAVDALGYLAIYADKLIKKELPACS